MTVIAYDGLYVAADRMTVNDSGLTAITRKIEVWKDEVLASSGAADHGEALAIWYKDGVKPGAFPHVQPNDKSAYLYVFKLHTPVMCFQMWPAPVLFPMEEFAAGCGAEIARTAMHLGRDAREACKIAGELNVFCGNGVDYVDLAELANTGDAPVRRYAS